MIDEGSIIKDWRHVDLTFGLIYPNSYKLANSSYTIRLLYHMINNNNRFLCERIFLPEKIKYPAANDNLPKNLIRSLENKILPSEFDVLGVSIHYENDFKNILWLLDKANIPLHREERNRLQKEQDIIYPLLIAGGPVVTSNPLPLSDIFDVFFIGDSENTLIPFFDELVNWKSRDRDIKKLATNIRKLNNIYFPSITNHPRRGVLENLDNSPNPIYQTISKTKKEGTIFERNFFIEINRGCPFQCKFCISSFHNNPFRNRSYANIIHLIEAAIKATVFEKISLIGSCVSSHPKFKEICEYIIKKGKKLSIPSIRLDHITEELISLFEKANMNSITIAPETGSESLRFELGKKISNQKILKVATKIFHSSIRYLKLYFLLGLPYESDDDIKNIIILLKELDKIGFERGALKVNINPLIPKLNTPYGNYVNNYLNENFDNFISRFQQVMKEIRKIRAVKLKSQYPKKLIKEARLQTLFSLGDAQFSSVLIEYYCNGARYRDLEIAEKRLGYSAEFYLKKIQQGYSPWII
jgi:radical SAM superfamily enzyme YgiQ (UPF0313 family)